MSLTKKQREALKLLKKGENVFLSGEGGTGKSYVIEQFTNYLENENINYVVCAPTGLAALNVGGSTLHRTFKLSIELGSKDIDLKNVERAKVIIIDEISMCRRDIFQTIARALKDFEEPPEFMDEADIEKEKTICRKKQIVLVGDFFQLPPFLGDNDKKILNKVKEGEIDEYYYKGVLDLEEKIFPFQCEEWDYFGFENVVLDEVVRQKDKEYINNLNLVRRGDEKGLKFIRKESSTQEMKKGIYLTAKNADADNLNRNNLDKIDSEQYTYWSEEEGIVSNSDKPVADRLDLKKGARVMCVVNVQDKDKSQEEDEDEEDLKFADGIVNGMCGTVRSLTAKSVTVDFDNGQSFKFEKYKWSIKGFKRIKVNENGKLVEKTVMDEIGTYKQIPLKLAWAITIHKSQGQSYDEVNLDPRCFAEGQLYVALSRAKDIKKLHLTKRLNNNYLMTSEVVKQFYKKIEMPQIPKKPKKEPPKEKEFVEVDFREVFEDEKVVEITKTQEKTSTTKANANKELVENFKKEQIKDFEVEEEYIFMKIPRSLEKVVERVLNGEVNINSQSEDIKALEDKIKSLEQELEKANRRRSKIPKLKEQEILELRKQGFGMNKIAKLVGVGDGTVRRVLADYGVK